MIGNHRDAWVYGAVDPGSGTAATMEMCRALGAAVKNGWKPRRTLLYASWDAEEYGLVGSTEWAEEHAEESTRRRCSCSTSTRRSAGRSSRPAACPRCATWCWTPPVRSPTSATGKSLRDSGPKRIARPGPPARRSSADPLWDATVRRRVPDRESRGRARGFLPPDGLARLRALITPRFSTIWPCRPSTSAFKGGYGVYHSIYDDFNWMEKFGDPEFLTHATAARLYTLIAMRAAAADVVPLQVRPLWPGAARTCRRAAAHSGPAARKSRSREADAEPSSPGFPSGRGRPRVSGPGRGARPGHRRPDRGATTVRPDKLARLNDAALAGGDGRFCSRRACPTVPGSSTRSTRPA